MHGAGSVEASLAVIFERSDMREDCPDIAGLIRTTKEGYSSTYSSSSRLRAMLLRAPSEPVTEGSRAFA